MMLVGRKETGFFCQGWERDDGVLETGSPGKLGEVWMMGVKLPFLLPTAQVELHVISTLKEQPSRQDKKLAIKPQIRPYVRVIGCGLY